MVLVGGATRACLEGGYTGYWDGVGTGEGYTGYYPPTAQGAHIPAKRAPEALQGLEWVGIWAGACSGGWTGSCTHPPGPVALQAPWYRTPRICRLLANKGEITVIFLKT